MAAAERGQTAAHGATLALRTTLPRVLQHASQPPTGEHRAAAAVAGVRQDVRAPLDPALPLPRLHYGGLGNLSFHDCANELTILVSQRLLFCRVGCDVIKMNRMLLHHAYFPYCEDDVERL